VKQMVHFQRLTNRIADAITLADDDVKDPSPG
jgi:hypothetical protein